MIRARAGVPFPLLSLLFIGACGGGDGDSSGDTGSAQPPPATTRGSLTESPPPRVFSLSAADLLAALNLSAAGRQVLELVAAPRCGVDVHRLRYNTVDPANQPTTASGALMIPTGTDAGCQGPRPVLVYAHGTRVERARDIADVTNTDNGEGLVIATFFAAHGYIVVAPNYAGFDTSTLAYHPFLHADQQSKDTADALAAARSALPTSFAPSVTDGAKLFVTGYSQGGHVAMATHRQLQQTGIAVTASAPMSGPYALGAFGDAVFYGQVVDSAPLFVAFQATAYQRAYGNIYTAPTDMFEARYASGIDSLFPTSGTRSDLFAQGRLPRQQLFSSTPPDPSFAPYTPATTPAELAPVFARGFGPENLVTNAFRLAYLQDAQAHPDGGFPTVTDGATATSPANGLRMAFTANDLRNWVPTAPVLLCGGHEDPTVLFMNTDLMRGYWAARSSATVRVLDVDGSVSLGDPDTEIKAGFAAAKAAVAAAAVANGATDNGAMAVAEAYHSSLVPPFCLSAVRRYFDGF
jgi:poly(3-hydroxybutyrate) depolymerase